MKKKGRREFPQLFPEVKITSETRSKFKKALLIDWDFHFFRGIWWKYVISKEHFADTDRGDKIPVRDGNAVDGPNKGGVNNAGFSGNCQRDQDLHDFIREASCKQLDTDIMRLWKEWINIFLYGIIYYVPICRQSWRVY